MPHKNTRIKDIARLAGVSIGTVDRVLHNRGEVAEKTRLKIQRILDETKYSPNLMAQVLKSKKRFNLVSLLPVPTENNQYWEKHPEGITRALEELGAFPISFSQIRFDIQSEEDFQIKTEEILNIKPDGVILAPVFKSESISFCKRLSEEKVPFVFVDGYLDETEFLTYIGEDIYQSGRVAGQLTDLLTPTDKDILVVNISKNILNIHHLNSRTNGFINYLKKTGLNRGKKLTLNIQGQSKEIVYSEMDKVLKVNPGIGSVFISGSKSYLIAGYLEEKNIKSLNLTGYDLLRQNVEYLKSGAIKFLIGQRPEEQTYRAVKRLFDYLSLKKIPEKFEYIPIDIISSENVDFFTK